MAVSVLGAGTSAALAGRTQVLYGDQDALTSRTMIERFRQESGAHLTIMEGGEHWFHTPVQMAVLQTWEETNF